MNQIKIGQGMNSMRIGTQLTNLSLARFNPYCDKCKTDFEPTWTEQVGKEYKCSSCGIMYPVNKPQPWLKKRVPKIKYLVNALLEYTPPAKPTSSKPIIITCPSCSAGLDVNGSTRFIDCNYCSSQIYLSDDIWMKFHTVKQN